MGKITAPSLLTSARRQFAPAARTNPSRPAEAPARSWRRSPGPVLRQFPRGASFFWEDQLDPPETIRELWFRSDDAQGMIELVAIARVHPAHIAVVLYMIALAGWKAFGKHGSERSSQFFAEAMVPLHNLLGEERVPYPSWGTSGRESVSDEDRNRLSRGLEFFVFVLEYPNQIEISSLTEAIDEVMSAVADAGVPDKKMTAIVRESIPWGVVAVQLDASGEDLGEPLWVSVIAPYVPRLRSKADARWVWDNLREYAPQIEQIAREMASTGRWSAEALTPFVAAAVAR